MMKFKYQVQIVLGIVLFIFSSCKKTDWEENYKEREKSPFGNYIISKEAPSIFKDQEIIFLKENFYDFLILNRDTTKTKTYLLIKNTANKQTDVGNKALLNFVKQGNTIFLSLNDFHNDFKKPLEFKTVVQDSAVYSIADLKKLAGSFSLENLDFKSDGYNFDRNIRRNYFELFNKNKTTVLGTTNIGGKELPNFIKINFGKGVFYLHSNPIVFTNYFLLNGNTSYVSHLLSYVPKETILWDVHVKASKYSNAQQKQPSIFKFFLKHASLTWFLFVSFIGLLLFMLFNARRKQRAIPVVTHLENTTVAFTQTIANLYLSEGDHKNLVEKKTAFFLEKVRSKYLLDTTVLNAVFIQNLATKSGNELQKTKYLIHSIIALSKKDQCTEEELIGLQKMIENFLKK